MVNENKTMICFGDAAVDIYSFIDDSILKKHSIVKGSTPRLSKGEVDSIVSGLRFDLQECGGAAANTAKGFSALGGKVGFFGKKGKDSNGEIVEKCLLDHGVRDHCITEEGETTTYIYTLITPDAQRTMLAVFGATSRIKVKEINFEIIQDYDYVLLEGYQVYNHELARAILNAVKGRNKKFILTLSNVCCVRDNAEIMRFLAEGSDIISGNLEEFLILFECGNLEELLNKLKDITSNKYDMVILTNGEEGAYLFSGGKYIFCPPPKVKQVVDTTGAGDYFAGAILYGYLNGVNVNTYMTLAQHMTDDIISKLGVTLSGGVKDKLKTINY